MPFAFTSLIIDRDSHIALSRQLYQQLQQQILQGKIGYKEKLPSTRALTLALNISRSVVVESYEMLTADGLVLGMGKAGTVVCYQIKSVKFADPNQTTSKPLGLSNRGQAIATAREYQSQGEVSALPLTPSVPDFRLFPEAKWTRLYRSAFQNTEHWYNRDGGLLVLKKQLQRFLAQYRGIELDNLERLFITTGTQASLNFLVQLLADENDTAVIEQPCWLGSTAALKAGMISAIAAEVDQQGAVLQSLIDDNSGISPRLIILTPSAQFPTGNAMSMQRREEILKYSATHQSWLIEDDYAAEYAYEQHPPSSLLAHGDYASAHTIHVGTMSKLMLPSLRLGWMIVPQHISAEIKSAINIVGIQPSIVLQQHLSDFMQQGHLNIHLANTRATYNRRRKRCETYLQQYGKDLITVNKSINSMNLFTTVAVPIEKAEPLQAAIYAAGFGAQLYIDNNKSVVNLLMGHANIDSAHTEPYLSKLLNILLEFKC